MNFKLKVWRQKNAVSPGSFKDYDAKDIPSEASFLEMLDIVNESLTGNSEDPIEFDSDCREGICGMCSLVINGIPHGPGKGTTCQVYMRRFTDGDTIWIEPFRAAAFSPIKDLVVDRSAFDRIIQAGGYIVVRTGSAPEANSLPVPKHNADLAMEAAACIGCGACVAACPNSSAMLFVAAKVSHLGLLPQGQAERETRAIHMVREMDELGFGNCRNYYECEAICPAEISATFIARLNRDYAAASAQEALTV
ncbi:MAG: succinate dehydrogenase/fumarate reductase iron-sulfur subunit [Verrucomicrobia bacterium]|nr:succinate dehydrogenase/fumarate reductase iron-sulfur subunit [Verrucomicrobiota bacterium]